MRSHALRAAAGNAGGGIQYIGSVTKNAANVGDWDTSGEALDVLSLAQTGDLVVIAFSFDSSPDDEWNWVGTTFTEIQDETSGSGPGAYSGYRFIQAGDQNPYIDIAGTTDWKGLSVVASVFRNVESYVSASFASGISGLPNPPSLTANGKLWVVVGHLDDDQVTDWGAPENYTLADSEIGVGGTEVSSTAIAYRIEDLASDNPKAFTGTGSDSYRATTIAFD